MYKVYKFYKNEVSKKAYLDKKKNDSLDKKLDILLGIKEIQNIIENDTIPKLEIEIEKLLKSNEHFENNGYYSNNLYNENKNKIYELFTQKNQAEEICIPVNSNFEYTNCNCININNHIHPENLCNNIMGCTYKNNSCINDVEQSVIKINEENTKNYFTESISSENKKINNITECLKENNNSSKLYLWNSSQNKCYYLNNNSSDDVITKISDDAEGNEYTIYYCPENEQVKRKLSFDKSILYTEFKTWFNKGKIEFMNDDDFYKNFKLLNCNYKKENSMLINNNNNKIVFPQSIKIIYDDVLANETTQAFYRTYFAISGAISLIGPDAVWSYAFDAFEKVGKVLGPVWKSLKKKMKWPEKNK